MKRNLFSRRNFLILGTGGIATTAATLAYTLYAEPFWLEFVKLDMPLPNLPSRLRGKTLMQISDIHISRRVSTDYLIESFRRAAEHEPDIIAYTGDFITEGKGTAEALAKVAPYLPHGKIGSVAILGNHDYGWNREAGASWNETLVPLLESNGIAVLRNEQMDIEGLQLIGLDDLWNGDVSLAKSFEKYRREEAAIALAHNPDTCDLEGWENFQGWILSGHTHGGQCKPPFLPPPLLPVKNRKYTAGHIPLAAGRDLYINRALGYLHQARFNVRPEITIFTLT